MCTGGMRKNRQNADINAARNRQNDKSRVKGNAERTGNITGGICPTHWCGQNNGVQMGQERRSGSACSTGCA